MMYPLIFSIFLFLLITLYIAFKKYEIIVCSEVCAIYCNTIVFIDQLCGVNNDIMTSWHKFCLNTRMKGEWSLQSEKKLINEIIFRKNEIERLKNNYVHLSFQPSGLKSIVLHKHKLSTQEIQVALDAAESSEMELLDNINYLLNYLNSETRISSYWLLAENRLKCFQYESNILYYGALEGLCSFPSSSLMIYEQQRTKLKFLPADTSLTKRKEDYLHLQEIEFKKAEDLLNGVKAVLDDDSEEVNMIGDKLFSRQINVFFAGSKALQTERDIYSNVVSQLQTKWKDNNIHLYGYSFQNFEHEFVFDGHQCTYNDFIKRYADVVIFVLNGNVGGKTLEEFDVAMNSFKKCHRPLIYVYSRMSDAQNEDVEITRNRINEESQYWQDYSDNDHLRLLIKNDLIERLQKVFEEIVEIRRELME